MIRYVVQEDDTLWSISREHYKDGRYWTTIYVANIDKLGLNPDLVITADELIVPKQPYTKGKLLALEKNYLETIMTHDTEGALTEGGASLLNRLFKVKDELIIWRTVQIAGLIVTVLILSFAYLRSK